MKIGMILGCFCPLHQGHLNLIMQAKKQNDLCYIIVCGYENDRGGTLLPLSKRYRYIKEEFKNDPLVKVICVNDTKLGIDESMSDSNWKKWMRAVLDLMENYDMVYDKVWYVGESTYVEPIKKYGFGYNTEVILVNRQTLPISATMIRNNPLKYWNYIAPTFRKIFSHNILITGTASEGKTTLTQDIARYFGLPYSKEMGRLRLEQTTKTDEELDFTDFHFNLYEQNKANAENIDSLSNHGIIISDTDNLVTLMYAKRYAEEKEFLLTDEDYQTLYAITKCESRNIRWSKIFVLAPKGIFVDDGTRCMKHSDMESRIELFNHLISLLDEFGYEYEILNGNYYENFLRVKGYIEELYE